MPQQPTTGNIISFSGGVAALGEALRTGGQTDAAAQQFSIPQVLDDATPEDLERQGRMKLALQAYNGNLLPPLPKGRSAQKTPDANVLANRCEPIVTAGVAFLAGKDVTLTVEAEDESDTAPDEGDVATGNQQAQDFLDEFAEENQLMTLMAKDATNGGIFGHPFLKLIPYKDTSKCPRLLVIDPQNVRVETDPDDYTTAIAYIIQYRSHLRVKDERTGKVVAKPIDKRQVIERLYDQALGETPQDAQAWRITDQQRSAALVGSATTNMPQDIPGANNAGGWQTVAQTDWPYPWPPIFDNQNLPEGNEYWGREDLTHDLIESNIAYNRAQSNGQKILDWWASPRLWIKNVGDGSQIEADPSRATKLPPNGEMGVIQPISDLSALLNYLSMLRSNMDEQSRVPAVAVGRLETLPRGNLSGIALQLLFQPLLQKTESKRRLYGEKWERLCTCVLEYAGFGSGIEVAVGWPDALPKDAAAQWAVAAQMHDMGVSQHTILTDAGYDADSEMQRTLKEKQDAVDLQQKAFSQGKGLPGFPPTSRGIMPPQAQSQQQPPDDENDEQDGAA